MTITLKEFIQKYCVTEEIHDELKQIINSPETRRIYQSGKLNQKKLNKFSSKVKELISSGIDTGLESDKPKKGSSRAVFFPKEHKDVVVDGKKVKMPTAIKIAFAGALDKYSGDTHLLGEHQNNVENDYHIRDHYSMLKKNYDDGSYSTNERGVVTPFLDDPTDHNHWLETVRADNITKSKFKNLTKTDTHPEGLDFDKFHETLQEDHAAAHGQRYFNPISEEEKEHIRSHPLFENTQDFVYGTDNHPADFRLQNWGVWKHPVTGKEHPVIRDYGYSNHVAKLYTTARRNKHRI